MPLSYGDSVNQMPLQFAGHARRPFAAHANEADASADQLLYCGNADVLGQTGRNHLAFAESHQKRAAHRCARFAAATASLRLV